MTLSFSDIIARIEACEKPILLFGAYGNGNLGDIYQARSLSRILKRIQPDLDVFVTSFFEGTIPVDPNINVLPAKSILEHDIVNRFRALIIGGGGLLASKHRPLFNTKWVAQLDLPIILAGLGASPEVVELHAPLLERAAFVSARDPYSLEVVRQSRTDATFLPDPILADPTITPVEAREQDAGDRIHWVLRKANDRKIPLYEKIKESLLDQDAVVGIFPLTDLKSALGSIFSERIQVTANFEEFVQHIAGTGMVISNRYHGCIVSAKLGLPTMAFDHFSPSSKVFQISQQLGFPDPPRKMRKRHIIREDIFAYRRAYLKRRPEILERIEEQARLFTNTLIPIMRLISH